MPALRHVLITGSRYESALDVGMLLNEHPQVLLGIQRFSGVNRLVDRFLLAPERLVAPLSVETKIRGELLYSRLRPRIGTGQLSISGDVDPAHVHVLPRVATRLGLWRVVVVVDEPSSSPSDQWRVTLGLARESERRWFARRVLVLPYGQFAAGEEAWLEALLAFLELPHTDRIDDCFSSARVGTTPAAEVALESVEEVELLSWFRRRTETELRTHGRGRPDLQPLDDPPLDASDLESRAGELEELRAQRREGSEWPDEREARDVRHAEQVREIVARGSTVTQLVATATPRLPSATLRINLVAPQPQVHEIGRREVIEQLAGNLAGLCTVRLISEQPSRLPLPGVERRVGTPQAVELADCDALIYPAEGPVIAGLGAEVRMIMLLDGFTRPDDPRLEANLEAATEVLAASMWLCELARRRGARAIHFPLGLDRSLFAAGTPNRERGLRVTASAQTADHLGAGALSEAMVQVRERRPEVEVTLFGGVPADGATTFLLHPPLPVVADTLRSSAVHVTSARKEGFNFLGAAALASGAALVTTDTEGSRDFAIHGRTALVSPAGDAGSLAEHVLTLLDDSERRARLTAAGGHYVRSVLRPWPDVARRLAVLAGEMQ